MKGKVSFDVLAKKMRAKGLKTRQDLSFCQLTTMGCGGKIALTAFVKSVKQMVWAVRFLRKKRVPFVLLGNGSNVVAGEGTFCGVVLCTKQMQGVTLQKGKVVALAGTLSSKLSNFFVKHGLTGGEFCGCLPATVGGMAYTNAGCFGQQTSQIVYGVVALRNGRLVKLSNQQCRFGKRSSVFRNGDYVILSVTFQLADGNARDIEQTVKQMRQAKMRSQPLSCKSAGCVLYNPSVALSPLIERAGLKGYAVGGAQISTKHAGFVINIDKATSKDIYLVIRHVKRTLQRRYGVDAYEEVCFVNTSTNKEDASP